MRLQTDEPGALMRRAFALMQSYRDDHDLPEGSAMSVAVGETLVELDMLRERRAKEAHRTDQPWSERLEAGYGGMRGSPLDRKGE